MNRTRELVLRSVRVTINVVLAKLPVIYTSPPKKKNKKTRRIVTSRPNLQESEDDFHLIMHCTGSQRQVIVGFPPAPRVRVHGAEL